MAVDPRATSDHEAMDVIRRWARVVMETQAYLVQRTGNLTYVATAESHQSLALGGGGGGGGGKANGRSQEGEAPADSNTKAQALVMWGNALYELSQCAASDETGLGGNGKGKGKGEGEREGEGWRATLESALVKFKEAKCRTEEVTNALQMHCKAKDFDPKDMLKHFFE